MNDQKIYLDHGATTPVDPAVAQAVQEAFLQDFGNPSSAHLYGARARQLLTDARTKIAKRINAYPEEIVFTSGGSESDNWALRGAMTANSKKGRHLITTQIEHPAILATARQMEKEGFKVDYLPVDQEGLVDIADLEKAIRDDTVLVSIMAANNEIGTIQDLTAIGELCQKHDVLFHSDAVQAFTKVPLNTKKMNLDLMSLSAHKIHGPKGIGCLFIKKGTRIDKLIFGGHQEMDKRAGTENIPGIVGFGIAAELATEGHNAKMQELRDYFIKRILSEVPDSFLNGPAGEKRLCNNANISFRYIEGEGILMHLDMQGIAVSTGSACSSQNLEPSHVLTAIGLKHEDAHGSIRFTLGRNNTKEELDQVVDIVKQAVEKLRSFTSMKPGMKYDVVDKHNH